MHNGNWNNMVGGGWWWMTILMVVFWGGLIAVAITLIRRPHLASHTTAQTILAERLARGEIEPDEYHSRLAVLNRAPEA